MNRHFTSSTAFLIIHACHPMTLPMAIVLCVWAPVTANPIALIDGLAATSDPIGDTFGAGSVQHDIRTVGSAISATELRFEIQTDQEFTQPTVFAPNVLAGFIDIDVDSDVTTGSTSHATQFGPEPSGMGVDFFVDLFSEGDAFQPDGITPRTPGQVDFVDASTLQVLDLLVAAYDVTSVAVTIPRDLFPGAGNRVRWGVVVGTLDETTDVVLGTAAVPEPGASIQLVVAAIVLGIATCGRCMHCNHAGQWGY